MHFICSFNISQVLMSEPQEERRLLFLQLAQISYNQWRLCDLSEANVNLLCHQRTHPAFSLAKLPEGGMNLGPALPLILQPHLH